MPDSTTTDPAMRAAIQADVDRVCLLVPPLWELDAFVAVNPFLGFSREPVEVAARVMSDAMDAQVLPPVSHYRQLWREGALQPDALRDAAAACGMDFLHLESILVGHAKPPVRQPEPVFTRAERMDHEHGTRWEELLRRAAALWCERHFARSAPSEGPAPGLFTGWLADATMDRSLEIEGLHGICAWVRSLPTSAEQAIEIMLDQLEVAAWDRQPYLLRLLAGVHGWASHLRRWAWVKDRQDPGLVRELLAVRVCLDAAVAALARVPVRRASRRAAPAPVEDERLRIALQDAAEDVWARRLAAGFTEPPTVRHSRPDLQAVFCIDVRSEPFRRHLEACDRDIETAGFAGFFGMAVRWQGSKGPEDRCPVLVRPAMQLQPGNLREPASCGSIVTSLTKWPGSAFPAVETLGLGAIVGLLRRTAGALRPRRRREESLCVHGLLERCMEPDSRIESAAAILAGLGLGRRLGRVVLLVGHQGRAENNPHAAGLDCGACGGRGGALNARLAASLLNDPVVRRGLDQRGAGLPVDTVFVPAIHETVSDDVRLLDHGLVPGSHAEDVRRVVEWLRRAGQATRRERAAAMGVDPETPGAGRAISDRGGDWSQTRPEWALARNACFVAARRVRTAALDLKGRSFLHEYDPALDPDDALLSLILSAPMVVASWINLQYFASTVDNRTFGSGDKMLHNRVGSIGVVAGNGCDLRSGLPLQSVQGADGRWFHEPLRLQVFVEAPMAKIDRVLKAQPEVRELVVNGWVRLFAISPTGGSVARFVPGKGWEQFHGEADQFEHPERAHLRSRTSLVDLPEQSRPRAPAAGEGSGDPTA